MLSCDINSASFGKFLSSVSNEIQRNHGQRMAQIRAGDIGSPPWATLPPMKLTSKQVRTRSYHLAESVADYFKAFGSYPKYDEIRVFFLYATRKARFAQP